MKSDYKVVAFCLAIIVCLLGIFVVVDRFALSPKTEEVPAGKSSSASQDSSHPRYFSDYAQAERHLVAFDPNEADSTTLLELGLSEWTVRAIYKYRAKGGVYSTPEDFGRMYGITKKLYKELLPYIKIGDDYKPAADFVGPRHYPSDGGVARGGSGAARADSVPYPKKLKAAERLSVNDADTNALKRVPGIGSYYARKIVDLRERYGGFVSLDQLLSIKGLPESSLQYFVVPDGGLEKINVNKAGFKRLQAHPYIGYSRAKAISEYRRLKGKITSLKQLSLMQGFSAEEVARLEPYVEY